MKKMLLIAALGAAISLLSGCVIVSDHEHHAVRPPHVIYGPPCGPVEVIPAPPYEPWPYPYGYGYYFYYGRHW